MTRHAGLRREFIRAVDVLHVGPHLHDVEASVAVECHRHWFFDVRFAQHKFQPVAVRKLDGVEFLLRGNGGKQACGRQVFGGFGLGKNERGDGENCGDDETHDEALIPRVRKSWENFCHETLWTNP